MMITTKSRLFLIPVLLCSLLPCFAEAPSGQVTLSFDPAVVPIWDFSGTLQPTNLTILGAGGAPVPLDLAVDLTHEAGGRLRGSGMTVIGIGTDTLAADYRASGRVSGGGNATKVNLSIRASGPGIIAGVSTPVSVSLTYKLQVNLEEGTLVGTVRGHANISKFSGGNIKSDIIIPITQGTNAAWDLQMNIVPLQKLGGTGLIVLGNGRALPGNLSGNYSAKSNEAKVRFNGINEGKGSSVNVTFITSQGVSQVVKLRGHILGQNVRE